MDNKDILILLLIAVCIYLFYQNNVFEGFDHDDDEELTELEEELMYSLEETDDLPENLMELLNEEFGGEEEEEVTGNTGNTGSTGNSGGNSSGNSSGNTR